MKPRQRSKQPMTQSTTTQSYSTGQTTAAQTTAAQTSTGQVPPPVAQSGAPQIVATNLQAGAVAPAGGGGGLSVQDLLNAIAQLALRPPPLSEDAQKAIGIYKALQATLKHN
jgi:hypothetical protein